jgi:histidyl-tRNA synthetase
MPPSVVNRPPGFHDRTPQETAESGAISGSLQRAMAQFGYQLVETPLIEYSDLFLTKSGDEAINRLFNFEMYGRQLCLRPEFTASAARLYIERYQHELKPIRWQFAGPIFRYESPQRSHSRQFTMLGVELIGPSGVSGDAEVMAMAAHGLLAVGLRDWTLVVGHVGLVSQLLDRFALDRRTRRFVLGQIENLRRPDRGLPYVESQFERLYAGLPEQLNQLNLNPPPSPSLLAGRGAGGEVALEPATEGVRSDSTELDISHALELLLQSANLGTTGTGRTNEDVARRLLNKQRRANQRGEVTRALNFLRELVAIEGQSSEALPALERLLPSDDSIQATVRSLRASLDLLTAYGIEPERVRLQMGLARGLNYYTGIVFEAHTRVGDSASQLCGGGRYDDLIRVLGATQDTPAVGFAYGLERILHELRRGGYKATVPGVQALVVPVSDSDVAQAAQVATRLRDQGANIELFTPPTRNLSQALTLADKRGTPFVIIVGSTERETDQLTVRDMHAGTQASYPIADLSRLVEGLHKHK